MPQYVSKSDLAAMITESAKAKQLTPELYSVIQKLVVGLIARYRFKFLYHTPDDCVQDFAILVSRKIGNIKTDSNCFSYLTTCASNQLRQLYRKEQTYKHALDRFYSRRRESESA